MIIFIIFVIRGNSEPGVPVHIFQPSAEQHEKLFHNKAAGYSYTRINNPTIAAFEERMTVLEKGVASVACASGMAAITNALLNIVGSGDEIITSTSLYGGRLAIQSWM